jgi:hypothetical protein
VYTHASIIGFGDGVQLLRVYSHFEEVSVAHRWIIDLTILQEFCILKDMKTKLIELKLIK